MKVEQYERELAEERANFPTMKKEGKEVSSFVCVCDDIVCNVVHTKNLVI